MRSYESELPERTVGVNYEGFAEGIIFVLLIIFNMLLHCVVDSKFLPN